MNSLSSYLIIVECMPMDHSNEMLNSSLKNTWYKQSVEDTLR